MFFINCLQHDRYGWSLANVTITSTLELRLSVVSDAATDVAAVGPSEAISQFGTLHGRQSEPQVSWRYRENRLYAGFHVLFLNSYRKSGSYQQPRPQVFDHQQLLRAVFVINSPLKQNRRFP